jgi:uncharacterized protein YjeT (DUF2065 family)
MNRTISVIYNSITTGLLQIVAILSGFITPRVMMTVYGSEINGLITSIMQFIAYFNLVEAGLAGAAIYALYKPLADKDTKVISSIVSAAKHYYTQAGYIFVSLTLGMAVIYPAFVKTNTLTPLSVSILVLTLGVSGALEFFTLAKYRALLTADQKTYVISLASISSIIISTTVIVIMAHFNVNIVIVRITALFSVFVRSMILLVYTRKKYKYINYKATPKKDALKKRWDVLYWQVTTHVQSGSTAIIATIFTDLVTVIIYTVYHLVIGGIKSLLNIFINGLYASFGDVIARGQLKTLQKTYREFEFAYYCLISVIFSVSMITIMPFIRIYTRGISDANYNVPLLGFIFVVDGLMYSIKVPQGMLVQSAGLYTETKKQVTVQGLIAVVIGVVLAPFYGLPGIMIGMLLSNVYRWIDLLFFIPHYVTKIPVRYTLLRQLRVFLSVAISCIPFFCVKEIPFSNPSCYVEWVIYSAIVGLYSVFIVFIMAMLFDRQELKNIIKRFKNIKFH